MLAPSARSRELLLYSDRLQRAPVRSWSSWQSIVRTTVWIRPADQPRTMPLRSGGPLRQSEPSAECTNERSPPDSGHCGRLSCFFPEEKDSPDDFSRLGPGREKKHRACPVGRSISSTRLSVSAGLRWCREMPVRSGAEAVLSAGASRGSLRGCQLQGSPATKARTSSLSVQGRRGISGCEMVESRKPLSTEPGSTALGCSAEP